MPTRDEVLFYVNFNARLLELPGHFLGGWVHHGWYYLDVSMLVRGFDAATREGLRNRQQSIFRLRKPKVFSLAYAITPVPSAS